MKNGELPKTVAVINSNEDVVESIMIALDIKGFKTISAHIPFIKKGKQDIRAFLKKHDPDAILYDIAPPYKENWNIFNLIKGTEEMKGRRIVLTTTNLKALQELTGKTEAIEILGKPFEIEEIVSTIHKQLAKTP